MNVLVTGGSGLVGSHLIPQLRAAGATVACATRAKREASDVHWDPQRGIIEASALENRDAIVHLAGENVIGLWTSAKKKRIADSRVMTTKFLVERILAMKTPPKTFVSASAIGYYGDRAEEVLTEESPAGTGFLAELCKAWEDAALPLKKAGIRVVWLRIGIVLAADGGALQQMLPAFKAGLGATLGSGQQYMSWIALSDLCRLCEFVLQTPSFLGPVNAVAPEPVRNAEFTNSLASVLGHRARMRMPAPLLKFALGELARVAMLASVRVEPRKALSAGFAFQLPTLRGAFQQLLNEA